MSLQNLLKIGQLKEHPPDAGEVQRLLVEGNMQEMHIASADKPATLYSLDVIISVSHRVTEPRE